MKIDWAPLHVPIERRLQTAAVASQVFVLLFGQLVCILAVGVFLFSGIWFLQLFILAYLAFVYLDRHTAHNGGRGVGCQWFKSWRLWKYFGDYFPVDLVRTVELRPDRNYVFALFPHGVVSFGAISNFNFTHSKYATLFPGIRAKMVTLQFHFNIPIFREILLSWGMAAASKKSISTLLNATNDPEDVNNADGFTSNGVMIVVGGAQEAFNAEPKNYTVVLKNRKGFVRLAMQSGTPIVPVISFNEVDIFYQMKAAPGTRLRRFQEWVKRKTGVIPILFMGRGFFQYTYGLLPMRIPITTVVGAPMEVSISKTPTSEEVDMVHTQFCDELLQLFETHKAKYIEGHEHVRMVLE